MIENPKYINIKGQGILSRESQSYSVEYNLFHINGQIAIYCFTDAIVSNSEIHRSEFDWTLEGETQMGMRLYATQLLITQLNDSYIELITNSEVVIGSKIFPFADKIEYLIDNLYDINLNFIFEDFNLSLISEKNSIKKNISKHWGIPQQSGQLLLVKSNTEQSEYDEILRYIIGVLCLSSGRRLAVGVTNHYFKDLSSTQLRNVVTSHNYIYEIVPSFEFQNLAETGISNYKKWGVSKKTELRILLEYINSLNSGYLDERVLNVVQCFEIISNNWIRSQKELSPELKDLKIRLKKTIRAWNGDNSNYDKNGFWSGRLIKSLDWEKTIQQLEDVLTFYKINKGKLSIDIKKLVELRHSVAHNGRLGKDVDKSVVVEEIQKSQFALQLAILLDFGYSGQIYDFKGKWKTLVHISEYLE